MKSTADHFFSETAEEFDQGYNKSPVFKQRFNVWTNLWPKYLPSSGNVLDLGCGSGVFSFALAAQGYRVTGLDGADNMIALCNKRKETLHIENARFLKSKIPFDKAIFTDQFDAIISSSVLEYIEDIDKVLSDIHKLLKPNGILIVSMPNTRALYRNMERISWKLIGRPKYMKYVHHVVNREKFNEKVTGFGFELLHSQFYGIQNRLSALLPEEIASTLFVSVFVGKNARVSKV